MDLIYLDPPFELATIRVTAVATRAGATGRVGDYAGGPPPPASASAGSAGTSLRVGQRPASRGRASVAELQQAGDRQPWLTPVCHGHKVPSHERAKEKECRVGALHLRRRLRRTPLLRRQERNGHRAGATCRHRMDSDDCSSNSRRRRLHCRGDLNGRRSLGDCRPYSDCDRELSQRFRRRHKHVATGSVGDSAPPAAHPLVGQACRAGPSCRRPSP